MNGTVILNCLAELSSSNKILVFICFSEKNTLQKTVFGCPCFVSLLGPGKVSFERSTPKRSQKIKVWDWEVSPEVERSRNYGTELNHRRGEVSSLSPRLCPISHFILFPCACYIGYTYRILYRKCGRTVFSYELLTYFQKSKEWDFWYKNVQRSRKYRTKHFPCGIVFVRYRDVHHWFC